MIMGPLQTKFTDYLLESKKVRRFVIFFVLIFYVKICELRLMNEHLIKVQMYCKTCFIDID